MSKYQGFTVKLSTGKTYWHSKVGSEQEVINHAKRYCHSKSDLIIYDVSHDIIKKNINCKFHKHLPYETWKEVAV